MAEEEKGSTGPLSPKGRMPGEGESLSRRERRRVETRERLFEAAMSLLSERDFDAVTVEMITEAADVGKGTFFNYFANKEAMLEYFFQTMARLSTELLQEDESASRDVVSAEVQDCFGTMGPVRRKLATMTHRIAELDGRSKRLARTLISLTLTNPEVRAAQLRIKQQIREAVRGLIEIGQATGEFRNDLPADSLTDHMASIYFSTLFQWSLSETDESLPLLLGRAYRLFWEGLRPCEK